MADLTADGYRRILVVPDERLTYALAYDATDSIITEQDYLPGEAEPETRSALVLDTSGAGNGRDYQLRIQRAGGSGVGTIGLGAGTLAWTDTADTAAPKWVGWEDHRTLADFRFVDRSTTANYWRHPDAVALPDGTTVVVAGREDRYVYAQVRSPADGSFTAVEVFDNGATYTMSNGPRPTILRLPSGVLQVYYWRDVGSTMTIGMSYSEDDGATWAEGSRSVIPLTLPLVWALGAVAKKLVARYHRNGAVSLVAHVTYTPPATDEDTLYQFASTDGGATFAAVETISGTTVPKAAPVLIPLIDGRMLAAWLQYDGAADITPYTAVLGSVSDPISSATQVKVDIDGATTQWGDMTAAPIFQGAWLTGWQDDDGSIYLLGTAANSSHDLVMAVSVDGGVNWGDLNGSGEAPIHTGDAASYLISLCAASHGSHVRCYGAMEASPATHDDSLIELTLGGWTTLPLPPNTAAGDFVGFQTGWSRHWIPIDYPDDMGWTGGTSGTPTVSMTSTGVRIQHTGGGDAQAYYLTPTAGLDAGQATEVAFTLAAGEFQSQVRVSDGAGVGYYVSITVTATSIVVRDVAAPADITTLATTVATTGVIIRAGIGNDAGAPADDGRVRVWYAPLERDETRRRFKLLSTSGALVDGAYASGRIQHGTTTGVAATDVRIHWMLHQDTTDAPDKPLYQGQATPGGVPGRPLTAVPTWLDGGSYLRAVDGPALAGQTWTMTHDARYPIRRIFWDQEPSPARGVRTATDSAQTDIVIRWDASETTWPEGATLAVGLFGCNVPTLELWGEDSGGVWQDLGDISFVLQNGLGWTRDGNMIRPDGASGNGIGDQIDLDALVGGSFRASSTEVYRIAGNAGGIWAPVSTVKPLVLRCEGDLSGVAASGTAGAIWSPSALALIPSGGAARYRALRLRIPAATTAQGDFRIGTVVVGHAEYMSSDYDWGWIRRRRAVWSDATARSGRRTVRRDGPAIREVELPWTQVVGESAIQTGGGSYPAPDYRRNNTGGTAGVVESVGDVNRTLMGLVSRVGGDLPVVYCGNVKLTATTAISVINNPSHLLLARMLSKEYGVTTVVGTEWLSEAGRGGTLLLEEIT